MQSFVQTNERSLRYVKADRQTDRQMVGQGRLLWTPSGKPGVQNGDIKSYFIEKWIGMDTPNDGNRKGRTEKAINH